MEEETLINLSVRLIAHLSIARFGRSERHSYFHSVTLLLAHLLRRQQNQYESCEPYQIQIETESNMLIAPANATLIYVRNNKQIRRLAHRQSEKKNNI